MSAAVARLEHRRVVLRLVGAAAAYPLLLVAALYLTWLCGWMALGHPPRPSLDDPQQVPWLGVPYGATLAMLVAYPAAAVAGAGAVAWLTLRRRLHPARALVLAALLIAAWMTAIALLRWDPHDVCLWFFD